MMVANFVTVVAREKKVSDACLINCTLLKVCEA